MTTLEQLQQATSAWGGPSALPHLLHKFRLSLVRDGGWTFDTKIWNIREFIVKTRDDKFFKLKVYNTEGNCYPTVVSTVIPKQITIYEEVVINDA